ncbi:hypothetical protein NUW58_g10528 [Xylaria curta]|uniref:Uncharacterized protein n=1 Tax=Xylaria curta TaxID=42375 RepID=A0ACC1MK55_9PEZI|nr:hypothetical protein NUW58_g10528 [Xylaria curta]
MSIDLILDNSRTSALTSHLVLTRPPNPWTLKKTARLQDILDFDLPKLHRWCGKAYEILSSLTRPEPTQEERKSLNTARKSFNLARRPLVDDDATYIDLSSSDLPYRDDPDVHATIDKATRSANLITLLLSLTDLNHAKKAISPFLQELDDAFPSLFDTDLSRQSQTRELALHIRCRQLVEWLGEEPESEPLILATTIFCKDSASTAVEAAQRLRRGPFRKLGDMAQGGNFTSSRKFQVHLDQIIAKLSVPERDKSEKLLNAAFPQDKILEELRVWALNVYAHVNSKADKRNLPPDDRNEARVGREESEGLFISENDEAGESSDPESSSEHEGYHQLKTLVKEPSFIQDPATLAADGVADEAATCKGKADRIAS